MFSILVKFPANLGKKSLFLKTFLDRLSAAIGWSSTHNQIQLADGVVQFYILAHLLPASSVYRKKSVRVSRYNCGFSYFSFSFCQFLLLVLWSSVARDIHILKLLCLLDELTDLSLCNVSVGAWFNLIFSSVYGIWEECLGHHGFLNVDLVLIMLCSFCKANL